jgi:hypothetical protein
LQILQESPQELGKMQEEYLYFNQEPNGVVGDDFLGRVVTPERIERERGVLRERRGGLLENLEEIESQTRTWSQDM